LFIRKIPRSKSGSAISYHKKISVGPLNLSRQFLGQYLKTCHDRFLRHNLQPTGPASLAIFHYSSQEKRSLLVVSSGQFSHNGCVSVATQGAESQAISCVQRSVFRYVQHLSTRLTTRNSSSGEWVPEYLVSMSFCGVALWVKADTI